MFNGKLVVHIKDDRATVSSLNYDTNESSDTVVEPITDSFQDDLELEAQMIGYDLVIYDDTRDSSM